MSVNNPYKFILLLVALGVMLTLALTNTVEWDDLKAYFALIVGYGVGNGIAAKQGQPSEPVFAPKESNK